MKVFLALVAGTIAASAFQISMPQAAEGPSPGEYLARAGNCVVCHTAPGGRPFAGGLKMATPGGVIYSTNIMPDKNTGIGNYTLKSSVGQCDRESPRMGIAFIRQCHTLPTPSSTTRTFAAYSISLLKKLLR
jgi:hypothetical protein